jgi:protein AroM
LGSFFASFFSKKKRLFASFAKDPAMLKRKLGTLTIGQAPRPDITPILDAAIPAGIERLHAGLLDGLDRAAIAAGFAPREGAPVLITRLLDGTSVTIDKRAAQAAARVRLRALEDEGCTTVLMLCTGAFEGLACEHAMLIEPDRIVPPSVAALAGPRQVGIIVPLASQIASEGSKWAALARPPICEAASPYHDAEDKVSVAAAQLRARGAEILVMDCMGFTERHRRAAIAGSSLPVILSNAMIAKLTSEIL